MDLNKKLLDAIRRAFPDHDRIQELIDLGADPNTPVKYKTTGFIFGGVDNYDWGYTPLKKNQKYWDSILESPIRYEKYNLIKLLLDNGTDPNFRNELPSDVISGEPPLIITIIKDPLITTSALNSSPWYPGKPRPESLGCVDIAKLLLDYGADPEIKGSKGISAYDLARQSPYSTGKYIADYIDEMRAFKALQRSSLMLAMNSKEGPLVNLPYEPSIMENISKHLSKNASEILLNRRKHQSKLQSTKFASAIPNKLSPIQEKSFNDIDVETRAKSVRKASSPIKDDSLTKPTKKYKQTGKGKKKKTRKKKKSRKK